ncbi:hypothetical protein [Salinisphaera aquimarina]|uniref:Uncharacterized protein n=1 Tax=Salinisphaera aquimarina TaxID=2094031 RepID=A0ABV7ESY3_9GAMM
MAAILPFQKPTFSAADLNALHGVVNSFGRPVRSQCWEREFDADGSEFIEFVDPTDWRFLTLRRASNGRYRASDEDGSSLAEDETFQGLLSSLGLS